METKYCYCLTWFEDGDEKGYIFYTVNDMFEFIKENLQFSNYSVKVFNVYQPEIEN